MGLLTKNDITWVSAVSESPFIAGFFPKPTFQKKAQTSKNRAHQNEFTAKDDAFLSGEACFFSFPFSFLDIESSSNFGGQQKMLLKVLWEFTLNFPHPHWQNNPIYGTGEMEKSRRKPIKNM